MPGTTWNPADNLNWTLSGGNLVAANATGSNAGVRSVNSMASGKFYWECRLNSANNMGVGIAMTTGVLSTFFSSNAAHGCHVYAFNNGFIYDDTVYTGLTLDSATSAATIGIALDATAGNLWFRVCPSGLWNNRGFGDPTAGSGGGPVVISTLSPPYYAIVSSDVSGTRQVTANFGDSAFSGAVPSGYTSGIPGAGGGAAAAQARAMLLA